MKEDLKKALKADPWKAEMLLYLRNLAGKFHYVSEQVKNCTTEWMYSNQS